MENRELRLKEAREKLRMTQTEIATLLGMAQQTYQKIESGKTVYGLHTNKSGKQ